VTTATDALITTGNIEIDKKVGGGLPRGSLTFF
jgi:archaellum biogenesis ATPase FlaH